MIGGDLNGHDELERNDFEDVLGIYGYGERNAEEENSLELCQSRMMKKVNIMHKKRREEEHR